MKACGYGPSLVFHVVLKLCRSDDPVGQSWLHFHAVPQTCEEVQTQGASLIPSDLGSLWNLKKASKGQCLLQKARFDFPRLKRGPRNP